MKRLIVVLVVLPLVYLALKNLVSLSADMLYGGVSEKTLIPQPIYPLVRLPWTETTAQYQAAGRIGSDFAQVYFPAQATSQLQDAYIKDKTLDPWARPSRYAPAVILLCSATICRLDFGYASLLNMLVQLALFFFILYWALGVLNVRHQFLPSAVFVMVALFLTPVGLSWFERGQFSLYVAASYVLLMLGLITKRPALVALAALLAFVKWTAFPAIAIIFVVYLLNSKNLHELKFGLFNLGVFIAITAALCLIPILFARGTGVFLSGLVAQELRDNPTGLSLLKYVPRSVVKLLPLLLIVIGYVLARKTKREFTHLIPYALGVAALMLLYPTRANDYSVPILLGFVPLMIYWAGEQTPPEQLPARALLGAYFLFIMVASFSTRLTHSIPATMAIYLVFSAVLLASPLLFYGSDPRLGSKEGGG
jgi:hypothetical protein